jgi:hypothetical protein
MNIAYINETCVLEAIPTQPASFTHNVMMA